MHIDYTIYKCDIWTAGELQLKEIKEKFIYIVYPQQSFYLIIIWNDIINNW